MSDGHFGMQAAGAGVRRARQVLLASAVLAFAILQFNDCSTIPRITAQGAVAGHALSGPVDSELARRYLGGETLPSDLELTRDHMLAQGRTPDRGELADIAGRYSPDVATLLFIETVSAQPHNRDLGRRFDIEVEHVRHVGIERARPDAPDDLLVLLVPGWSYVTRMEGGR